MKRTVQLLTVLIITAVMLAGCSSNDMNKMKEGASEIVSDVKDNLEGMADNATVNDGDGHIGENRRDDTAEPTDHREDMTEDDVTGEGIIDGNGALIDDPTVTDEIIQTDAFI